MTTEREVVLSINRISKTYPETGYKVNALQDVSFELRKGEMLAIMGTSGSGKSTLLQIVGALDSPDEGSITINGVVQKDMFTEPYATKYRSENIGYVFQAFQLLKDLTVEENIALPLILKGIEAEELQQQVDKTLDLVSLTKWRRHRPVQLSGGQQQRVAIGRAIILSPPILLADEPTGNLDFNTSTEILNVLVDMKRSLGQSMIIVTHDANVAAYADRILFFHDGKIVDTHDSEPGFRDVDAIVEKVKVMMEKTP